MSFGFKKILFPLVINCSFFILLMIGIQNSSNKKKVNYFFGETINSPIAFIVGVSFISGSISGSILTTLKK